MMLYRTITINLGPTRYEFAAVAYLWHEVNLLLVVYSSRSSSGRETSCLKQEIIPISLFSGHCFLCTPRSTFSLQRFSWLIWRSEKTVFLLVRRASIPSRIRRRSSCLLLNLPFYNLTLSHVPAFPEYLPFPGCGPPCPDTHPMRHKVLAAVHLYYDQGYS